MQTKMSVLLRVASCFFLAAVTLGLTGCNKNNKTAATADPLQVGVVVVAPSNPPLTVDIVGDVRAFREVELRPRVSGVVEKQLFSPGQMVREGETLFLIDTRTLDSSVADAKARLLESEAALNRARQDVERYEPLLVDDAIPRQIYEQAVSTEKQAASIVVSRKEAIKRAQIDRSFAEVKAPMTGQIGLQRIEVGGLATAGQTVLATVSTLDPVVVYFSVSESDYIAYAQRFHIAEKKGLSSKRPVQLILADGSLYTHPGKLDFADRVINSQTGTLKLRAVFPNPEELLRPGMTGRIRMVYDVAQNALVIPQKAVTELLGRQFIYVVNAQNKVEQRQVTTGARLEDQWIIETGLQPGERVIVEGVQKVRAGMPVKAVTSSSTPS